MNKANVILDLCGGTGSWAKPWKEAGYKVITATHPKYDVTKWRESPDIVEAIESNMVYGILAGPPCTMFSIARNDKTAKEPRDLRSGMKMVNSCLEMVHECLYRQHRINGAGVEVPENVDGVILEIKR